MRRALLFAAVLAACGRSQLFEPRTPAAQPCDRLTCPLHAHCGDAPGLPECVCDEGFELRGDTCVGIAATLDGLRWELPCQSDWPPAPDFVCVTRPDQLTTAKLSGRAGATYEISLRLRGVLETEQYTGGSGDGGLLLLGGSAIGDAWNVYRLDISSPAQRWHLNNGPTGLFFCIAVDVPLTVRATAGATFTLFASAVDSNRTEIRNVSADAGTILVPGLSPFPAAFDGQFLQMDVVSVREL